MKEQFASDVEEMVIMPIFVHLKNNKMIRLDKIIIKIQIKQIYKITNKKIIQITKNFNKMTNIKAG